MGTVRWMSAVWSWLMHRGQTGESARKVARTFGAFSREGAEHDRRMASSTGSGGVGTGLAQLSGGPRFVDLPALTQRPSELLAGLTPVPERAALFSFVGTGITAPHRYHDAAGAFSQFRLMAPADEGRLIQVFTQKLRDESAGNDFLYVHFAGDPLSFGCLICVLTGGGFMTGWRLS